MATNQDPPMTPPTVSECLARVKAIAADRRAMAEYFAAKSRPEPAFQFDADALARLVEVVEMVGKMVWYSTAANDGRQPHTGYCPCFNCESLRELTSPLVAQPEPIRAELAKERT